MGTQKFLQGSVLQVSEVKIVQTSITSTESIQTEGVALFSLSFYYKINNLWKIFPDFKFEWLVFNLLPTEWRLTH